MKTLKNSKDCPVFEPDEIVVTENQIFAKQLKVLLKQQIQIKTSFQWYYTALRCYRSEFPLYKFNDTLYFREMDILPWIKKNLNYKIMLGLDDKVMMERSILGTFCEYPKMCLSSIKYVTEQCCLITESPIYERLNAQISQGFAITKEKTWGGLMSTDDQRDEMMKIISSSRPDNLKPYIKALIEDESLSALDNRFQNAQDMVTSDKQLNDVIKYVTNQIWIYSR